MNCRNYQAMLSSYLDGSVTGTQMREISTHLQSCKECAQEFHALSVTQRAVAQLGRKTAPADLALRLKVAISQERAKANIRLWDVYALRFRNAFDGLVMPATTASLASLLLFFVLIAGVNPITVSASAKGDVPTDIFVQPKIAYSPFPVEIGHHGSSPIVVETVVDANGRVQDYRIISGNDSEELRREIARSLIFTTFEPARQYGRPVASRIVISFGNIDVNERL